MAEEHKGPPKDELNYPELQDDNQSDTTPTASSAVDQKLALIVELLGNQSLDIKELKEKVHESNVQSDLIWYLYFTCTECDMLKLLINLVDAIAGTHLEGEVPDPRPREDRPIAGGAIPMHQALADKVTDVEAIKFVEFINACGNHYYWEIRRGPDFLTDLYTIHFWKIEIQ